MNSPMYLSNEPALVFPFALENVLGELSPLSPVLSVAELSEVYPRNAKAVKVLVKSTAPFGGGDILYDRDKFIVELMPGGGCHDAILLQLIPVYFPCGVVAHYVGNTPLRS